MKGLENTSHSLSLGFVKVSIVLTLKNIIIFLSDEFKGFMLD